MRRVGIVLSVLALSLVGCKHAAGKSLTQTEKGMVAVLTMSPTSPVMMEPVALSLSLTGPGGETIKGAQVFYDLTMPGMVMPPNQPQAREEGQGVYLAKATFTMAGEWRVEATVSYGKQMATFAFDLSVE